VTLPPSIEERKAALREQVRARRRARSEQERAEVDAGLAVRIGSVPPVAALVADPGSGCVAAYASFGTEPRTDRLRALLELSGVRVLLPVIRTDGGLEFAWDTGTVAAGAVSPGVPEPTTTTVAEGMAGLVALGCRVVLTPALAVDRRGRRIGKAGGYYDRLFAGLDGVDPARRPLLVAVVHDDDVVDEVPADTHDRSVDAILTPTRYLVVPPS
jgi:5-formyltetrahydrofolate cyclo-ligase